MFWVVLGVLIFCFEIEELVDLIVKEVVIGICLLDIGIGSGCIVISLVKYIL